MDLTEDQKNIIDLFVKQELLIEKLYQLFAERYPAYKDFWNKMAKEEYQHSVLIHRMIDSEAVIFTQGELRSEYLNSSIEFIDKFIAEFKKDKGDRKSVV